MKVIMLVGMPASGKSTWAQSYCNEHKDTVWISSDNIREMLYGNAAIQGDNHKVFDTMHRMVIESLSLGHNVVYDATNVSVKDRKGIINLIKNNSHLTNNVTVEAKVFIVSIDELKRRNASRERSVPEYVYDRMMARFVPPMEFEGFSAIEYIYTKDSYSLFNQCLLPMIGYDQRNPHHSLTLFDHCYTASNLAKEHGCHDYIVTALLYHDCGKPECCTLDEEGVAHYRNHNNVGAYKVLCTKNITESIEGLAYIAALIAYHMEPYNVQVWENKRKTLPEFFVKDLEVVHQYDKLAH